MSVTWPPAPGTSWWARGRRGSARRRCPNRPQRSPIDDGQRRQAPRPRPVTRPRRIGARRTRIVQSMRSLSAKGASTSGRGAARERDCALLLGEPVGKLRAAATCASRAARRPGASDPSASAASSASSGVAASSCRRRLIGTAPAKIPPELAISALPLARRVTRRQAASARNRRRKLSHFRGPDFASVIPLQTLRTRTARTRA